MLDDDNEIGVEVGVGPEPDSDELTDLRITPNGRHYRIPDPEKKVISLEDDCGLLLFDAVLFLQVPGYAERYLDPGNPTINAQWKKKNLLEFKKPWKPRLKLPK